MRKILRFTTSGSVDDGKSTLIGRLLCDAGAAYDDHVASARGDLARFTDGLRAEREQGITIDVAHRYFSTKRRRFIVADTPGHAQYTRNMVSGCSTADVALLLVDARRGIVEQTRRHAYLATLLRVPRLVVCVNKMDLVGWSADALEKIRADFPHEALFIPISALHGDNVVARSSRMAWYEGPTLLEYLEEVEPPDDARPDLRFPVQHVLRPENGGARGYAGWIARGTLRPGDEVGAWPSGVTSRVREIRTYDGPLDVAVAPMAVTVLLEDEIDIGRGMVLSPAGRPPIVSRELDAIVCWMHEQPLARGARYLVKHLSLGTRCLITAIPARVDLATLAPADCGSELALNDIGYVRLTTMAPLAFDLYDESRATGCFILVDETTHATAGAAMIVGSPGKT